MLTKNDLNQIRTVVEEVVEERLEPIKSDIGTLKQDVGILKTDVKGLKQDVGILKKDMRYVKKTLSIAIKTFDETDVSLTRRVTRIEKHLDLSPKN